MREIKEVLRLHYELHLGQGQIARSCSIGLGTVNDYLARAERAKLQWPISGFRQRLVTGFTKAARPAPRCLVVAAGNVLISRRCDGDQLHCREEFGTKPGIEFDVDRPVGILQLPIPDNHTKSFFDHEAVSGEFKAFAVVGAGRGDLVGFCVLPESARRIPSGCNPVARPSRRSG